MYKPTKRDIALISFAFLVIIVSANLIDIENQLIFHENASSFFGVDSTVYSKLFTFFIILISSLLLTYPFARRFNKARLKYTSLETDAFRIKQVFTDLDSIIIILDSNYNILEINDKAQYACNESRSECMSKKIHFLAIFSHLKNKNTLFEPLNKAKLQGACSKDISILDNHSATLDYSFNFKSFINPNTKDINYIVTGNNVSKIKSSENNALKSRKKLNGIIDNSPIAIIEMDRKSIIQMWNNAAEETFNIPEKKAINKLSAKSLFLEKVEFINAWNTCIKTKKSTTHRCANIKDGKIIFCDWQLFINTDKKGNINSVVALIQDVTNQIKYFNNLKDNEAAALLIKDVSNKIIENKGAEETIENIMVKISEYFSWSLTNSYILKDRNDENYTAVNSWSNNDKNDFPVFTDEVKNSPLSINDPIIKLLEKHKSYIWSNDENPEILRLITESKHFKTVFILPIFSRGKVVAIIELFDIKNIKKQDHLIELINKISHQIKISLDNIETEKERSNHIVQLDNKVKVSNFLYSSLNILFNTDYNLDDIMPVLVNMLLATLNNFHTATVKIKIYEKEYLTGVWFDSPHSYQTPIKINQELIGYIDVIFPVSSKDIQEPYISDEEHDLMNSVSGQIVAYLHKKQQHKALEQALAQAKESAESANKYKLLAEAETLAEHKEETLSEERQTEEPVELESETDEFTEFEEPPESEPIELKLALETPAEEGQADALESKLEELAQFESELEQLTEFEEPPEPEALSEPEQSAEFEETPESEPFELELEPETRPEEGRAAEHKETLESEPIELELEPETRPEEKQATEFESEPDELTELEAAPESKLIELNSELETRPEEGQATEFKPEPDELTELEEAPESEPVELKSEPETRPEEEQTTEFESELEELAGFEEAPESEPEEPAQSVELSAPPELELETEQLSELKPEKAAESEKLPETVELELEAEQIPELGPEETTDPEGLPETAELELEAEQLPELGPEEPTESEEPSETAELKSEELPESAELELDAEQLPELEPDELPETNDLELEPEELSETDELELDAEQIPELEPEEPTESEEPSETAELELKPEALPETNIKQGPIDLKALENSTEGDTELLIANLKAFKTSSLDSLTELNTCLQAGNVAQITELGHKMASAARGVYAKALADMWLEIETLAKADDLEKLQPLQAIIDQEVKSTDNCIQGIIDGH